MLREAINKIHDLTEEEEALFLSSCVQKKYDKKAFLLSEGQICKGVYFIQKGIVGLYEIKNGKEIYQDFFFEQDFATNISSLSSGNPSRHFLVALEKTEVQYCSKKSLLNLYGISPNFQELGRKLLQNLLVEKTDLSFIHTSLSAKEKYDYVLENKPHLLQSIPLQYLSTYLGMARETLSRIRKEK